MTQYKIENTSDHIAKCDGLTISTQVTGNDPLNAIVTLVTYLKNRIKGYDFEPANFNYEDKGNNESELNPKVLSVYLCQDGFFEQKILKEGVNISEEEKLVDTYLEIYRNNHSDKKHIYPRLNERISPTNEGVSHQIFIDDNVHYSIHIGSYVERFNIVGWQQEAENRRRIIFSDFLRTIMLLGINTYFNDEQLIKKSNTMELTKAEKKQFTFS